MIVMRITIINQTLSESFTAALHLFPVVGAGMSLSMARAGMSFSMIGTRVSLTMIMVIAMHIGIIIQSVFKQCIHSIIACTVYAAKKANACLTERISCTCANAAANERVHMVFGKEKCECAMSASIGVHDLSVYNLAILNIIDFEAFGMSEMLKYASILICHSYSHFYLQVIFIMICFQISAR